MDGHLRPAVLGRLCWWKVDRKKTDIQIYSLQYFTTAPVGEV